VLKDTGGVAEQILEISKLSSRRGPGEIIFEKEPDTLIARCLNVFHEQAG